MGISIGISSDNYKSPAETRPGNPDPSKYVIVKAEQIGDDLVVKIRYPDCKNYEGNKILVYEDFTLDELRQQVLIDPHFSEPKIGYRSPVARFEPTSWGWKLATEFCKKIL